MSGQARVATPGGGAGRAQVATPVGAAGQAPADGAAPGALSARAAGRRRPAGALATGAWWALPYLSALAVAEVLTALHPLAGAALHLTLLFVLVLHSGLAPARDRPLLLALTLAPLLPVVALALPLAGRPALAGLLFPALPALAGAAAVVRVLGLGRGDLGLRPGTLPQQAAIGLSGIPLAVAVYAVFQPPALATAAAAPAAGGLWLPLAGVLLVTGFLEEFVFRGVLQAPARRRLGAAGLVLVSAVCAVLTSGAVPAVAGLFAAGGAAGAGVTWGAWAVLLAPLAMSFAVSLVFAAVVARTGSLLGVAIAHGLANAGAFLLLPLLLRLLGRGG
jgi:membrane protease YdiL (CAAX protease family)